MIKPSPGLNQYTPLSSTNLNGFSDSERKARPSSRDRQTQQYPQTDNESNKLETPSQPRGNSKEPIQNGNGQHLQPYERSRDLQLSKLQSEKHYFMKNALESKYKLQERESIQEENEKLKHQLKELKDREKNLAVLVENQRSQLEEVERHSPRSNQVDTLQPSSTRRNGSLTTRKPFNSTSDFDPYPSYINHESEPKFSARDLQPVRNGTPRSLKKPEPLSNQFLHSLNHNPNNSNAYQTMYPHHHSLERNGAEEYSPIHNKPRNNAFNPGSTMYPNNFASVYNKPNNVSVDDIVPDDVIQGASPQELKHYVKLLQKNYVMNDKQNQQENDNLRFKNQRLELSDAEKEDVIKQLLNELEDSDQKLKEKEKELSMAYSKMKSSEGRRPMPNLTSLNHNPNGAQANPQRQNSLNNGTGPTGTKPFFENNQTAPLPNGNVNGAVTPPQSATIDLTDDNLRIATHGRLTRITIWSNQDRIFGLSFQYVKDDGVFIEGNNKFFYSKNLQYDCFDLSEDDEVVEIAGSFNISGVKTVTIKSRKKGERVFFCSPPRDENDQIIEVFALPLYQDENYLKIVFPNLFTYNMKGARIEDPQDQNFFYAETNRIASLQSANIQQLARQQNVTLPPAQKYVAPAEYRAPPAQPVTNPNRLNVAPQTNPPPPPVNPVAPVARTPPMPLYDSSANQRLPDEFESLRPKSHYFSDYYQSYKIKEAFENEKNRAHFTDADVLYPEARVKIYQMKIWADDFWIFGVMFTYLTPDGYGIIEGKRHLGIENLVYPFDQIFISQPQVFIHTIQYWKKPNSGVQKMVVTLSTGESQQFGQNIPSKDAKEFVLSLDIFSYIYGSLGNNPDTFSPGNLVLTGLKVGVKEDPPL